MAIDTEAKRKAVIGHSRKWHPAVIVPDGSLSQDDREIIGRSFPSVVADTSQINTEARRKAVASVGRKWHPGVVVPDSTIGDDDRDIIARNYPRVTAVAPGGNAVRVVFGGLVNNSLIGSRLVQ